MKHNFLARLTALILLTIVMGSFVTPIQAQETGKNLAYGDSVTGEITDKEFEVNYQFSGDKGDVIIIKMRLSPAKGALGSPAIILSDSTGKIVADTTKGLSIGTAVLPIVLAAKDDYTIIATRRNGRTGKDVGPFTLDLLKPSLLELNQPVSDKASYGLTKDIPRIEKYYYYTVKADSPIKLTYQKKDGAYAPVVSINTIKNNRLFEIGALSGDIITDGTLGFVAKADTIYVVKIGSPLLSFSEGEAEYSLMLSSNK